MQDLEMKLFDALECVTDALADGIGINDPKFMAAAQGYAQQSVDHLTVERLVQALRKEFCDGTVVG